MPLASVQLSGNGPLRASVLALPLCSRQNQPEMNGRIPAKAMVILALCLLWGEALASPFLACRYMMQAQAESLSMEEHCAGMMIADMEQSVDDSDHFSAESSDQQQLNSLDCSFVCQYCRTINSIVLPEAVVPRDALLISWVGASSFTSPAPQPPSDHFRPPAAA